jgi:formyl-CoA transferase
MLGVCLAISALQTSEYFGTGKDPLPLGSAHPRNAPYQGFRARDKHFVVAAGNNNLWEKLCDVVGLTDLVHDPRFESNTKRAVNQAELKQILEAEFMKEDAALWLQRFEDAGVPCSSINKFSEALTDAQVEYAGWVSDLTMPNGQTTRTFGSPLSINGINPPIRFGPPALDEHRESILAGLRKTQTI